MPIDDTVNAVVIGPDADELRCRLGPASWTVLEAMMQRASETDAGLAVAVSIRSLAASLGLSKDTIARSVRRLRDAGLVSSIQRRDTSGAFAAGSYRLAVPRSCLSLVSSSVPVAGAPAESLVRPARRSSGQLALSRGLRSLPVFVCRFAPSSISTQVHAFPLAHVAEFVGRQDPAVSTPEDELAFSEAPAGVHAAALRASVAHLDVIDHSTQPTL